MTAAYKCSNRQEAQDVPAHGRGAGTRWSSRSLPTQTTLWIYERHSCAVMNTICIRAKKY